MSLKWPSKGLAKNCTPEYAEFMIPIFTFENPIDFRCSVNKGMIKLTANRSMHETMKIRLRCRRSPIFRNLTANFEKISQLYFHGTLQKWGKTELDLLKIARKSLAQEVRQKRVISDRRSNSSIVRYFVCCTVAG